MNYYFDRRTITEFKKSHHALSIRVFRKLEQKTVPYKTILKTVPKSSPENSPIDRKDNWSRNW